MNGSDPLDVVRDALTAAGCDPKGGQRITAKCPAHGDTNPSLSVARGTAQPVVLKCHAGCDPDDVLAALRLKWSDLAEDDDYEPRQPARRIVAVYKYTDEAGTHLFDVVRFDPKDFRQRHADGRWGLHGARVVPYHLPELIDAVAAGRTIYVAEGEKDVHAIEAAGQAATCNPGGAGKWRADWGDYFTGADVVIIADDDGPGHHHAQDVARHLGPRAESLRIMLPIGGAKDAAQHLGMGHGLDDLRPFDGSPPPVVHPRDWEPPSPLGAVDLRAGPVFPAHRLPPWLNDYVCEVARSLQTPVDLPALLVLSVLAAAAGGRASVEITPGWVEPLNLYTAVAMPPGARKTPVFQRVTRPLEDAEREAIEKAKPEIDDARLQHNIAKGQADKAEADAIRASDSAREEAENYAKAMRALANAAEVPVLPRLMADDATPEALASLLAAQGGRLAMFSDEGEVFNMMAGRYSTGNNLGVYLKAHVGSPLRVDRKGRDAEFVQRPALTLGLTIQPGIMTRIAGIEGARARGLLGRFLWSIPPSNIGGRETRPGPVDPTIEVTYITRMRLLINALEPWRYPDTAVIVATSDADATLARFEAAIEKRMGQGGDLAHIADWAAKLGGHVARIAALLHLADDPKGGCQRALQARHMDDAVHIGHWLIGHALIAFEAMAYDPVLDDAYLIARWMTGREVITRRDVQQSHARRFPRAADITPALEVLVDHGYLKVEPVRSRSGGGRPSATRYRVNPLNSENTP